jgi:hypothetical protein
MLALRVVLLLVAVLACQAYRIRVFPTYTSANGTFTCSGMTTVDQIIQGYTCQSWPLTGQYPLSGDPALATILFHVTGSNQANPTTRYNTAGYLSCGGAVIANTSQVGLPYGAHVPYLTVTDRQGSCLIMTQSASAVLPLLLLLVLLALF